MEETKELQNVYKIFRTLIYVTLLIVTRRWHHWEHSALISTTGFLSSLSTSTGT